MVIPVLETRKADTEQQLGAMTINNPASVQQAQDLAKRRISHYRSLIEANKDHPTDQGSYTEERITLKDGGQVISVGTPEGRIYYLANNEQWMFLETSTDERIQTLLLCENASTGPDFTQKWTSH